MARDAGGLGQLHDEELPEGQGQVQEGKEILKYRVTS